MVVVVVGMVCCPCAEADSFPEGCALLILAVRVIMLAGLYVKRSCACGSCIVQRKCRGWVYMEKKGLGLPRGRLVENLRPHTILVSRCS